LAAIGSARQEFLNTDFLETAPEQKLRPRLERFYDACMPLPLHREALLRRVGLVRHGLMHLLQGRDPLPYRLQNCLSPRGPYFVAGLGPQFWGAVAQALGPMKHPSWLGDSVRGLRRLGLLRTPHNAGPAALYTALLTAVGRIQRLQPVLSAAHIDHFLTLVARMPGRDPWAADLTVEIDPLAATIVALRRQQPLRQCLIDRGRKLAWAQETLKGGLANREGKQIGSALSTADPAGSTRSSLDWADQTAALVLWVERLWQAEEPAPVLAEFWREDPLPAAGLWLPAAVLHLRDPQRFSPWNEEMRQGLALLDDSLSLALAPAESYRLANEAVAWLRERYQLHPLEVPDVLMALGAPAEQQAGLEIRPTMPLFDGFCPDTFQFLEELARNNRRQWMEQHRERYRFAVRQPLIELCQALASRYVEPVLHGVHSWQLDSEARSGRALTSICRNAYGRGDPYATDLWIAFGRHHPSGPRDQAQFFVRLDAHGLRYGMRVGRKAAAAVSCLRRNVQQNADLLWQKLADNGALATCLFGQAEGGAGPHALASAAALWDWANGRSFEIACTRSADDPLLSRDELVGEILLTFDRLVPAFACAVAIDASPLFGDRVPAAALRFSETDFQRDTSLDSEWLRRTRGLLDLKRQLILQGVPGTGKTHVARCLARYLTGGHEDAIRLVQFHPAYSYEEFVEGIKVRSVEVEGRHDVTYPVEDGLLCAFAAEAASRPAQPHVLLIDEINRGNLPRLFGELLYLLEYREQSVRLPYSRRAFQLPSNLYLLGTMNAADRSIVLLDQALRRRFSIVDMKPDTRILSAFLEEHAPDEGPAFSERVLALFERLNARLAQDVGPHGQIGHSYFMVPELNETRLRMIWQHHVWPLLEEHLAAQPRLLAAYHLDDLLDGDTRRGNGRRRRAAALPG